MQAPRAPPPHNCCDDLQVLRLTLQSPARTWSSASGVSWMAPLLQARTMCSDTKPACSMDGSSGNRWRSDAVTAFVSMQHYQAGIPAVLLQSLQAVHLPNPPRMQDPAPPRLR